MEQGFFMVTAELMPFFPDESEGILDDVLGCVWVLSKLAGDLVEALAVQLVQELDGKRGLFG